MPRPDPSSAPDVAALEERIERCRASLRALSKRLDAQVLGQRDVIKNLIYAVLAGGHVLLEGAPGLGKTTLAHALAEALELTFRRVQFTPDLMPSDVLGARVLHVAEDGSRRFEFEPGPIFTHVLLADEINRATPRTQAALLEAMQERQVTLHGATHKLDEPFLVIATQNPLEMEGTYPLPEAQLDRFLFELFLELPDERALVEVLSATTGAARTKEPATLSRADLLDARALVRQLPAPSPVVELVARLILATHPESRLAPDAVRAHARFGASPRGGQSILLAAKARALLDGRVHVTADDVAALAAPALRHRIALNYEGEAAGARPDDLVAAALGAAQKRASR
ncbi:MAG: AAA family ATPase [Planctomycetota bacterium]